MKPNDVDVVLLAGGSTLLAVVQEGVAAYFGKPGALGMDPTEVVAIGASLAPI
jgi:molecular chaperone DnaK (HSP70)